MDNKDKMKFDSFPCSMGIVKQEREDDYDEGERGPCSLEMIKQEMEEETVVELQSCTADIKQELGGKTKRFPCDKCSEVFDSAFVRWRHMGDVHQKSHRCSLCNREFASKKQVHWHKKMERGCKRNLRKAEIPKECPTCGRQYTVMSEYFRHVEERCRKRPALTGVGRFPCSECGLVLHLERLLKAHRAFKHPSSLQTP